MAQKKIKFKIGREIIHYFLMTLLIGALVVAFIFRENINSFFNPATPRTLVSDPDVNTTLNNILGFVPKVVIAVEIAGLMLLGVWIVKLLSRINIGITDKGKTIFKIILSIIKWVIIIACVFWILATFGVNVYALMISAGIITLIIGLSAQSLISDILAGIFIAVEGEYLIGDIVVIDGWRGKVKNVTLRTTEIQDIGGNIKIINNAEIKSIINLTNLKSLAMIKVYIASSENLKEVERIFEENLPIIKEHIPYSIGDITYKGISQIDSNGMCLLYAAECFEEDIFPVERTLNREFKYVMDEHGISGNEPIVIFKHDKGE